MDDERAMIFGIEDEPRDVTAQLVLADWYAERGRPEEAAWRWIAAFRRRPTSFRAYRIDHEPYWAAIPCDSVREDEYYGGDGWINWHYSPHPDLPLLGNWPWSAGMSTLPSDLFKWLPWGNEFDDGYSGHRPFNSVAQAFDVLVKAFLKATRPRTSWLDRRWNGPAWEPDWALVDQVPNE